MLFWILSLRSFSLFFSLRAALLSFLFLRSSSSSLFFLSSSFFFSYLLFNSFTIDCLWIMEMDVMVSFNMSSIWSWWSLCCCISDFIWLYNCGTYVDPIERSTGLLRAPKSTIVSMMSLLNIPKNFLAKTLAITFFSICYWWFLVSLIWEFLLSTSSDLLALCSSSLWVSINSASFIW